VRHFLDRLVGGLVRLVLRVFFRRVEVVGLGRLAQDRPLLVVANHTNALIDPLLIVGVLPRVPRLLAKSTLWKKRLLRLALVLGGAVPVYRRQDPGVDPAKNAETFSRCHDELAAGGWIALFPEGISHNEPALTPLKTGTARIALSAEAERGPLGLRIVPVGLTFEAKERFRSRVLVEVGEAIDPTPELALYDEEPQAAVRSLTDRIAAGLERVTVGYGSWREAALIGRAADLFGRPELELPRERPLAEEVPLHRALVDGYQELRRRHPEAVAAAARAVGEYDRLLAASALTDEQAAARYPVPRVALFALRTAAWLSLVLPVAVLGMLLNWPPYRLAGWIGRRAASTPDQVATYKLFPSILLFPAYWAAAAVLAGAWTGWGWGVAAVLAAPPAGWVALRFDDRRGDLWREARAYLLLATRRRLAGELRRLRRRAHEAVSELVELHGGGR
jgi:1-acyl-sn-glycerol-3-phosphate acyltransferase